MQSPPLQGPLVGLIPIVATPFDDAGCLDTHSLGRLLEFQLASDADGVAIHGMASEAFALTNREKGVIANLAASVINGALPIVHGINATSSATAVEQARAAEESGATHLMVLPPFMVKPSPSQLVDFYSELTCATQLPVMIQDAPNATGVVMSPDLIASIVASSGITLIKIEAPPTARKIEAAMAATPNLRVFGGLNAQSCFEEYSAGAVGTMPACEFTDYLAATLKSREAGEVEEARERFYKLLPLIVLGLQPGIAWGIHKEVLVARGLISSSRVRSPAIAPDPVSTRAALAAARSAGLLP